MNDTLHLAVTPNDAYAEPLRVLLTSILANNNRNQVHIHIIHSHFSDENKARNLRIVEHFKGARIDYVEVSQERFSALKLPDYRKFPPETYYQFVLAEIFPDLDRILYLDVDIIVNGDLSPLWRMDISDCYCAGAHDIGASRLNHKQALGMDPDAVYMNSGVLLHNLARIRADGKVPELFQNTYMLADQGRLRFADQDVLSYTLGPRSMELDSIYNYCTPNARREFFKRWRAVIIHYLGHTKPWVKWNPMQLHGLYYRYEGRMKAILGEPYSLTEVLWRRCVLANLKARRRAG